MILCSFGSLTAAQEKDFSIFVDSSLHESGFAKFLLPRFSLKTGVRIDLRVQTGVSAMSTDADVTMSSVVAISGYATPVAVFQRDGEVFYLTASVGGARNSDKRQKIERFFEWLASDVGKRTISQFEVDGKSVYFSLETVPQQEVARVFEGSVRAGEILSYSKCGRCHVVGTRNLMAGIGSTPSFALMKTFEDWERRFEGFFTLRPHPSFSQIVDVTEAFGDKSPPAIVPLRITVDELYDILAFVATIEPADLGAPLRVGN